MADALKDALEQGPTLAAERPSMRDLTTLDTSEPRYVQGTTLGEGGMGVVSSCFDRRIGRDVAKKVMPEHARANPRLRARFLREALVQAQLEHPSVLPVHEVGLEADGSPYFLMKRVRGTTLEQILEGLRGRDADVERTWSRHKLLTAFASVCLAVDFAHARGIVHRDLKPGNVMLGDFGEVYVLDWGIAKVERLADPPIDVATPSSPAADSFTAHGAVLGTPGYMAPEQLEAGVVDGRADVYALGAILFEILTLARLHEAKVTSPRVAKFEEVDARASLRAPERDVPPELEPICVKATERDRERRYASARELQREVERFLEGDRDVERRRSLAREHATRAREQIAAGATTQAARSEALRDLGRALALDPENTIAADDLASFLTQAPAEVPTAVREAIAKDNETLSGVRARTGLLGFSMWFLCVPFFFVMGIRSYAALAFGFVSYAAAIAAFFALMRRPTRDGSTPVWVQLAAALALASTTALAGPIIIVPPFVVLGAFTIAIGTPRAKAWLPMLIVSLTIVGPYALELVGIVPASYKASEEGFIIMARMVNLPAISQLLVVGATLLAFGLAVLGGTAVYEELARAQKRLHLYAWQLGQLVPQVKTSRAALAT